MKTLNKILFYFILLLFCAIQVQEANAQKPAFFNSDASTGSNTIPLANTINRTQWIYGPNLFKSAGGTGTASGSGTITKVYFRLGSSAAANTYTDFTVTLSQNAGTATSFGSTTYVTGTQVFYSASYTMTGATVNSWYGIDLQTPFFYDANKSLVFEIKVSSTSGSNYVNQSSSGGRLYGPYSGATGQGTDASCLDFGVDLAKGHNDAAISKITPPLCDPPLVVTYSNNGLNSIDSVKINWSVNGTLQKQNTYTKPLATGSSVNITLSPDYNFIIDNKYTIKSWTSLPNDKQDTLYKNDTSTLVFSYIGVAGTPVTKDVRKCGPGKVPLTCTSPYKSDSIVWYNVATGGSIIARGKNTMSPSLFLGVNTFYAQAFKISAPASFGNSMQPSSGYGGNNVGGMLDLTPNTNLVVDSFECKLVSQTIGATYDVYMKTGSYKGSETNAAAWTKIVNNQTCRVFMKGSYASCVVKLPEVMLSKGITYGFYFVSNTTVTSTPWSIGSATFSGSNADMTVFQDRIPIGLFSASYAGLALTWMTYYRTANCPSARVPLKIVVDPSPNSAEWRKSTPFQTTMATTNGTLGTPDVVAHGDQLTYELVPPKTYLTSGHGTSWKTFTPVVTTKKGANIPLSAGVWTFTPPIGSAPGQLVIKPTPAYEDELFIVSMRIEDMGPYYCDSTILKHVYIAPRPHADFKFNTPICDGDAVLFSDKSTILAGPLSYKWEFNTSNPADTGTTSDIVFTFPTFGTYDVKLTAISKLYGYKDSKTYQVIVTEIPKVDFKVLNACEKVAVTFKNNTTIGTGSVSYDWDFGDPSTTLDKSTLKEPGWIYAAPNAYKVTLRASANGCAISLTKNANQFATPKAGFSNPGLMCDKSDVLFSNTSTIKSGNMGYNWNFGDGGISNFASPTHQFATFAPKTVKLKAVSEFGCVDSFVKTIALFEAPLADFTWGAACNLSNTDFLFTGTKPSGSITNFNWDFSEGAPSTLENPSKKFDVVSRKQVTLSLTSNNGCSNSITKEVNVKLQSKAQFNIKDVCEDDDAVFVNTSIVTAGNLIYNWKFGDGSNSASQSPRHRYIINGVSQTFNVTLVAIVPGGCSDSTGLSVTVNAKPKSDFSFATSGRQVSFTAAQPNNTLYQWRFGDGGSSTLANTQYSYLTFPTGKYTACLAVINAAGCFSETCKDVLITGGIDKITKLSGVKVYPNPNKGNFTITVEDPKSDISIAVYNLLGDVVKTIETSQLKSTYSVDLNVANGVYMVKVTNGGLITTQKVTINK